MCITSSICAQISRIRRHNFTVSLFHKHLPFHTSHRSLFTNASSISNFRPIKAAISLCSTSSSFCHDRLTSISNEMFNQSDIRCFTASNAHARSETPRTILTRHFTYTCCRTVNHRIYHLFPFRSSCTYPLIALLKHTLQQTWSNPTTPSPPPPSS
jgi:hypothetical protein